MVNTSLRAESAEHAQWSRGYSKTDPYLGLSVRLTSPSTSTAPFTDIVLSLNPSPEPSLSSLMSDREDASFGPFCKAVARKHYWKQLDGRPVQDVQQVYIDEKLHDFGRICSLSDLYGILDEGARVRLLDTFPHRGYMLQRREVSLVWWADQALFRLIPRGCLVGPNTPDGALAADLVCARLRTRQNVLRNVRVRGMTDEVSSDSRHHLWRDLYLRPLYRQATRIHRTLR